MEKNLIERLLENLISKTFLTVIGLIGTAVTIYAFFQEHKAEIRYEIISNTNVLDFNADINKLEVYYDSTNLKQTQENLIIYTVRIINKGDKDILKSHFDENDPLGIRLTSGKIIEKPQVINASSNYIKKNLKIVAYSKQEINFSQIILEPNEFYTIKLLILHKIGQSPRVNSIGKIAGQKEILVVNPIDSRKEASFLELAFSGNFWVQISRLLLYFLSAIMLIAILIVASVQIESYRGNRKKKKLIAEFKNLEDYEYSRIDDALFDRYRKKEGVAVLKNMYYLTKSEKILNKKYSKLKESFKSKEYRGFTSTDEAEFVRFDRDGDDHWHVINLMLTDGLVFREDNKLVINQGMKYSLNKFILFLREKGELKKSNFRTRLQEVEPDLNVEEPELQEEK